MLYLLSSSRFYIFSARCRHPALDAGSISFSFLRHNLSHQSEHETRHATSLLSSRVKHGMTALQQRLVVSGKRLVLPLAVRMVLLPCNRGAARTFVRMVLLP